MCSRWMATSLIRRQVSRITTQALERFGRIDTLINNAGLFIGKAFTDYTADDYASVVAVNLTGFFWLTQRVIVEMLKQGRGHIINISTTLVDFADSKVPSALVSLTKGGVAAATRSLAIEFAPHGIRRSNAVSWCSSRLRCMRPRPTTGSARSTRSGRVGQEPATSSTGIFSPKASPFITGEILHVDGGQSAPGR